MNEQFGVGYQQAASLSTKRFKVVLYSDLNEYPKIVFWNLNSKCLFRG